MNGIILPDSAKDPTGDMFAPSEAFNFLGNLVVSSNSSLNPATVEVK